MLTRCKLTWAASTLILILPATEHARAATEDVFRSHKNAVLRVRILERSSGAQAAVGSGFFAGPDGLAVTNYHVIAHLVWKPGAYEGSAVLESGESKSFELLAVDVVHDLALLRIAAAPRWALSLAEKTPPKGQRLYALGNPHDLGMTIVEGSFSGLLEESLVQRVHLTGTLNPGMSGGPVLDGSGRVVGVSAASASDEVSFLVPVKFVRPLLTHVGAPASTDSLRMELAGQLSAHQETVASYLTATPFTSQSLGPFHVPGKLSAAFRCWANSDEGRGQPYEVIHSQCSADDSIFIKDGVTTGRVNFLHHMLKTENLNAFQFSSLQKFYFNKHGPLMTQASGLLAAATDTGDQDLTPYDCASSDVAVGEMVLKAVVCLRAYKEIPRLYDLHWQGTSLVDSRRAFTSHLTIEGITRQNAEKFLRRYLEAFTWKK